MVVLGVLRRAVCVYAVLRRVRGLNEGRGRVQWAVVDPAALRTAMRRVVAEPVVARRLGVRAAAEVRRRWCREPVARLVSLRLSQIRDKLLEGDE